MPSAKTITPPDLTCVDCSVPGRGSWKILVEPERRRVRVVRLRSTSSYTVFYGTRTGRTLDDAEQYATALCAVLNTLKARRC